MASDIITETESTILWTNSDQLVAKLTGVPDHELTSVIYKSIMAACRMEMKKEKVVDLIQKLICKTPGRASSLITDVFGLIDQEIEVLYPAGGVAREVYTYILKNGGSLLTYSLQERLESDTLFEAGFISGGLKQYNQRFIRLKTKLFYKQQKFNLLREESEGYAKLLAELCQPCSENNAVQVSQAVQCLIGRFNLDPNRVVDIILQAFEVQPNCNFFITLLEKLKSPASTVCELLGSRLSNTDNNNWESLFILIAHLLQHRVISLEEINPWLTPDDRIIERQWARELSDAKEYARKSMVVTINKESGEEQEEIRPSDDLYYDNHKFLLCEALIAVGAWEEANNIMKRLPEFCFISNRRIAWRLIEFLEYLLRPIIKRITNYVSKVEPAGHLSATNSKVPKQICNYEDFSKNCHLFLALGPYIHYSPGLMYKLLRLMTYFLVKKGKIAEKSYIYFQQITILDQVILPGLCFIESNSFLSEEIWNLLKLYPYQHRFRLYGAWKGESILILHPSLLRKRVDLIKKVKHLMRRLSKENVKPMGRHLGKLSHSMPAVVFDYLLSQIQLFDNLITPVIDALKFLTSLSYDVLGYCILEALSPSSNTPNNEGFSVMLLPNRPRTKHDGSTIAPWLQSLASFTGSICKKYPIELVPLLQYIANQLKSKQSLDLLLLQEIVQKMTGIEAAEEITSEQLDAMAGGELLRGEAGYFGQVRTAKKSATRFREASSMNDLAVTLCILMAQQRDCIIYNESNNLHTKLVGKLYDQCQDTLVQFGSFLAVSCTLDDYAKKIPPLRNLVDEYHVSSDVAYFLWRPLFAHAIQTKYDELRKVEKIHKMTTLQRHQKYAEAASGILDPIADVMRNHLPLRTWDDISPQFYVTFWSLTLYDLFVPTEAYNREVNRIKSLASAAADNKDLASSKRKKEQERCNVLIEKLHDEKKRQKEHVERVLAKLNKEKDTWFASRTAKSAKNEAVTAFLQYCLFPRSIFTAPDALYCAHFVNIIHSLSTPNFSTLICYDRIFCDIIYTVTSCSENEANRYGRFLCALLGTVMKWHGDKAIFDKECASFPGFITKFRAANASATDSSDHVEYENYRHVCHKWHYKITKSVIVCLESKDFTQIRNSLIVLKRILPHYPKVLNLAGAVERWVERVRTEQKDKRQDLFALATSYVGQLKSRWGSIVAEEDFHLKNTTSDEKRSKTPETSQEEQKASKAAETKQAKSTEKNDNKPIETKTKRTIVVTPKTPEEKLSSHDDPPKPTKNTESKLVKQDKREKTPPEATKSKIVKTSKTQEQKLNPDESSKSTKSVVKPDKHERLPETSRKSRGSDNQDSPRDGGPDSKRSRLEKKSKRR